MAAEFWFGRINAIYDLSEAVLDAGVYVTTKFAKWLMSKLTGDPHWTNFDGCKFDF